MRYPSRLLLINTTLRRGSGGGGEGGRVCLFTRSERGPGSWRTVFEQWALHLLPVTVSSPRPVVHVAHSCLCSLSGTGQRPWSECAFDQLLQYLHLTNQICSHQHQGRQLPSAVLRVCGCPQAVFWVVLFAYIWPFILSAAVRFALFVRPDFPGERMGS